MRTKAQTPLHLTNALLFLSCFLLSPATAKWVNCMATIQSGDKHNLDAPVTINILQWVKCNLPDPWSVPGPFNNDLAVRNYQVNTAPAKLNSFWEVPKDTLRLDGSVRIQLYSEPGIGWVKYGNHDLNLANPRQCSHKQLPFNFMQVNCPFECNIEDPNPPESQLPKLLPTTTTAPPASSQASSVNAWWLPGTSPVWT